MLLANEQLEPSDNEQATDDGDRKASNGATDEELTPLHWLHDKNLLKGNELNVNLKGYLIKSLYHSHRNQLVLPQSAITI